MGLANLDLMLIPTHQLPALYAQGVIRGVVCDSEQFDWEERKLARRANDEMRDLYGARMFADAWDTSKIAGTGKGKRVLGYHAWWKVDPKKATKGAQRTGDCVSWGVRGSSDTRRAVRIIREGALEQYFLRQNTALSYSGRGHTGQGASPVRMSNWHCKTGFLFEEKYEVDGKAWDFTDYQSYVQIGMRMGRTGLPQGLIDIALKHGRHKQWVRVKTTEELKDLMANGYFGHCGFGHGVTSYGDPIAKLRGSTAHDVCILGYDDTREFFKECVFIWDQSWGNWSTVENLPEAYKPWPEGGYILTERDTQRQIDSGEMCVFVDTDGFDYDPLDDLLLLPRAA